VSKMRWRRWIARAKKLSAGELLFLARAGATATLAAGLLRAASLPRVTSLTTRRAPLRLPVPPDERLVALVDALLAMNRGPLRPNCMLRSLLLLRYLEGSVVLKVGIRPGVRPVDGHAWVERDGQPVAERSDPREEYTVTWSWPS
jgi:hypothetical protein